MLRTNHRPLPQGEDRYDSINMEELPKKTKYGHEPTGIRAKIKAKREKMEKESIARRAGDGVGGGVGNYFRILRFGTKWDYILMAIGSVTALVTGVAYPIMMLIFGDLVNHFFQGTRNSAESRELFKLGTAELCTRFCYIFLAKWVVGYISQTTFRLSAVRISAALRLQYLTCIFRQDLSYFDTLALNPMPVLSNDKGQFQTGQLSTDHTDPAVHKPGTPGSVAVSLTSVSGIVQAGVGERIGTVLQSLSMLIAGFTIAITKNAKLTAATASIIPLTILAYAITIPIDVKIEKRIVMAQAKAADLAEEILATVRTVKSFNAEKAQAAKYSALLNRAKTEGIRKSPISGLQLFVGVFVLFCGYAICFAYGVKLFERGDIGTPGDIMVVFFAVLFGIGSFGALAMPIQSMARACAASSIIFQVIDRSPLVDSLADDGLEPSALPNGDIELRNIRFSYPGGGDREKLAVLGRRQRSPFANPLSAPGGDDGDGDDQESLDLGGLSLTFPRNKTTAIVGASGAGKSTIVALLERWYEPQEGSIMIGDTDIVQFNLRWWRGKIGFVMQEPFLFNDSIFKNIANGLLGTKWENTSEAEKRKMVHDACIEANAADFVNQLPDKYNSIVGENGIKLSGGQKQRIAIARSIISKPPILILDEATSALDPFNERLIHQSLDTIAKGRTTIIIAHRLSTVKKADKIIVLDEGNIIESGSHEELMGRRGGAYNKLVIGQTLTIDDIPEVDPFTDQESEQLSTTYNLLPIEQSTAKVPDDEEAYMIPKKPEWKNIGIFKLVWLVLCEQRALWPIYVTGLVGAVGSGLALPMSAILFASFVACFEYANQIKILVAAGTFWASMFLVLAVIGGFMYFLMGWMLIKSSHISGTFYRSEYFGNVLSQGIPFFDKPENSPGNLTSRLNTYPSAIQECIGTPVGMVVSAISTMIASCTISLYFCPKLAIAVMAVAMPFSFGAGFAKVRIEKLFVKDSLKVFEESSQFSTEAVGAYRTVSSLCMERPIRNRYKTLLRDYVAKQSRRIAWSSALYSAAESMSILASAFTFWYGGEMIASGKITTFQFYVVYMTIIQGSDAVGQVFGGAHGIAFALIAANRMLAGRYQDPKPQGYQMDPEETGGCRVEFRDVNFAYPGRRFKVLHDLSINIEKGQFVGFVGPSGCGKTTGISLLERFYDPNQGEILIDGQSLASLDVKGYRDIVSLVAQEPTLYQGTVRENICLGAPENVTEDEIIQASQDAYLHDFVMSLPDGYNTICGIRGVGLSGGQKQRLSIARALIRKPRILLLDEATASLDSDSESIVQKALEKVASGRKMTMIAVAHRLSSIQGADVIFVFSGGRIVEKGNHEMLVRKRGIYFQMCEAQALDR